MRNVAMIRPSDSGSKGCLRPQTIFSRPARSSADRWQDRGGGGDAILEDNEKQAVLADRNLLYGIIALQMNFVSRDVLVKAMHDWVLTKTTPIEEFFYNDNAIGADTKLLLTALVDKHLDHHAGDAKASLGTLSSTAGIRDELSRLRDPDLKTL